MSVAIDLKGPRLEFVLRPIEGTLVRNKHSYDPKAKKIVVTPTKQEGGYMLYLPTGHSYRLTKKEAMKRGFLNRQPAVLNLDKANDTRTCYGRFKLAINPEEREKAWREMEDEVIKNCVRKHGPVINKEELIHERKAA